MKYILTRYAELPSNLLINILQYLIKNTLLYIILIIYLVINLLEKFNLNLGYIFSRALNLDNQDNVL